ncbi:MAG: nitroreductase family deazaflavin-dependent oxidoreductase [Acidimicrobiia bacterium]
MGLAADLGYQVAEPTGARKPIGRLLATRPLSRLSRRILGPTDRLFKRLSRGKVTLSGLGGYPPLWVTVAGARSGAPRTVPLLGIPIYDDIALIGSSFGQEKTPAWVHNLEAHPEATVSFQGREVEVTARPATPDEADSVWRKASAIYPGYGYYADRASHRRIRVFVLEAGPDRSD